MSSYKPPINTLAAKAKEINGCLPKQMDNKDYGKKRKAKLHKFSVKDTKTGRVYWAPTAMENTTFKSYLINERSDKETLERLTVLPDIVIKELKKLITVGAKDLTQNWKSAAELVNTAYHISSIRRPIPDQRGAWQQYVDLLGFGVRQLWNTRGREGDWRISNIQQFEDTAVLGDFLIEKSLSSRRFFVIVPNAAEVEIEGDDLDDVTRRLINSIRRHGASAEVSYRTAEGVILTVYRDKEPVEEIIIKNVS